MVFEGDVLKDHAAVRDLGDGVGRAFQLHRLVQHRGDAVGAGQRAGHQQKDVGDHHQGVHHLQHIAQKAGQAAHRQAALQDHVASEPEDGHHRGVHGQLEGRQVEHGGAEGGQADAHQLGVDLLEFFFLVVAPDKGFHRPDGGQAFLHHRVQVIHSLLQPGVHGGDPPYDEEQDDAQHRRADKKDHGQGGAHVKGKGHPQHQHGRPAHHGPEPAVDGVLDHGDVGGHPGDEGRSLEVVQVAEGVMLHLGVFGLADARAEPVGGAGRVPGVQQPGDEGQHRADGHFHAGPHDLPHVPVGNALVDDVAHQDGDHHLKGALDHHQ